MRLITLLLVIKLAAGQLSLHNDVELVPAMANMAQITSLDVQCEKSGMTVNVAFSQPFNGIIFSKGHFSNPACRYVEADTGQRSFKFLVPMDGCGTSAAERSDDTTISNTVIFQMDPSVQEVWDTAKKISCVWKGSYKKAVNFQPLQVSMLEVVQTQFEGNDVKCWMDIQQGIYPNTRPMDGILRIGEPLTVMVYLKESEQKLDVAVRDCWAYGEPEFQDPDTPNLQLTATDGCPTRMKLMHFWARTYDTFDTGASLIAYTNMSAFKFPDRMQVFLTCNVEICTDRCDNRCLGEPSEPVTFTAEYNVIQVTTPLSFTRPPPPPPICRPGSKDPRCRPTTICQPGSSDPACRPGPTISPKPNCYPGSRDPACRPTPTIPPRPSCYPGSRDPACRPSTDRPFPTLPPLVQTTPRPICRPGSTDPRCPRPTTSFSCRPGSRDPRCSQPTTPRPTTQFVCTPGSRDPRCPQPTTSRPTPRPTTQFICRPGSTDRRCPRPTTPRPTFVQTTPFTCRRGSRDPRCPQPTTPRPTPRPTTQFICRPGSNDPRCPRPTTPRPPPQPTTIFTCRPGSRDPRCPQPTTQRPTPRPTTAFTCRPGSRDPRCPQPTTPRPTIPFTCLPGSRDPRCPQPTTPFTCGPGSRDPRCPRPTTQRPTPRPTTAFTCRPGSRDPRCPQPTTPRPTIPFTCLPGSRDPRCPQPTTPFTCGPGSRDPRCPQSSTQRPTTRPFPSRPTTQFVCLPGSRDPRCPQPTTARPCIPGTGDPRCPDTPRPTTQFVCTPGSRDPRCQPATTPTPRPTPRPTQRPTPRPTTQVADGSDRRPFTTQMPSKDQDFHGDTDPKYHAFHSWLYLPPPRPRSHVGRRSVARPESMMISVGAQQLVSAPEADSGTIIIDLEGDNLLLEIAESSRVILPLREALPMVEDVPLDYENTREETKQQKVKKISGEPQFSYLRSAESLSLPPLSTTSALMLSLLIMAAVVGMVVVVKKVVRGSPAEAPVMTYTA